MNREKQSRTTDFGNLKKEAKMPEQKLKVVDAKMREALRKPFTAEAIKGHPTKDFITTIKAIYIAERLNDVFGIGRWRFDHAVVETGYDGYVLVRGKLFLLDYEADILAQYGGHKTEGVNTEPADGYKSAVTERIRRTCL